LSPTINKEEWIFTCSKCEYVPPKDGVTDDFVRVVRTDPNHPLYGHKKTINLSYPVRCTRCDSEYRSYKRRKKRTRFVWSQAISFGMFQPTYSRPKLITFALPSKRTMSYHERFDQIALLDKKLKLARKQLQSTGTLGGIYVIECTTRLVPFSQGGVLLEFKHHAHVHMVAISPYIFRNDLKSYCEQLLPFGLGRINLKAPKVYKSVSNYVSKYLSKDNQRFRRFGIIRGLSDTTKECRCKHDDMEVNMSQCKCFLEL